MTLPPRWRLALLVLALFGVALVAWLVLAAPAPAHPSPMSPADACAHMPEHCGGAAHG